MTKTTQKNCNPKLGRSFKYGEPTKNMRFPKRFERLIDKFVRDLIRAEKKPESKPHATHLPSANNS